MQLRGTDMNDEKIKQFPVQAKTCTVQQIIDMIQKKHDTDAQPLQNLVCIYEKPDGTWGWTCNAHRKKETLYLLECVKLDILAAAQADSLDSLESN
jgi:hypothetical protein